MLNSSKINTFMEAILAISISLFIIIIAVKATINFKPLYYYDINHLNIEKYTNINKTEIKQNYDILIDYLVKSDIKQLKFLSFPMSTQGEIHFTEVKAIFTKLNYIMYLCILIIFLGIYTFYKLKRFKFLKWSSITLLLIPFILAIPFAINFDKTFTIFHKIAFRNDYWLFDPKLDPVINILPEDFFLHCALMILAIIFIASLLLFMAYTKLLKKYNLD